MGAVCDGCYVPCLREWMERLTEAQRKFNTKGVKVVSLDFLSVEGFKQVRPATFTEVYMYIYYVLS